MKNIVHYILETKKYSWEETYLAIKNKEPIDWNSLPHLNEDRCELSLLIDDEKYPQKLTEIYMPPFELFYCGNYKIIDTKKVISVIGSLNGKEVDELIAGALKRKMALAILEKDLNNELYECCKTKNLLLIVICKSTINNFKYYNNQYSNLLLLSETNTEDWNRSEEQTYERILFSVANFICLKTNNLYKIISLHLNSRFKNKNFYVRKNFKLSNEAKDLFSSNELFYVNSYEDISYIS